MDEIYYKISEILESYRGIISCILDTETYHDETQKIDHAKDWIYNRATDEMCGKKCEYCSKSIEDCLKSFESSVYDNSHKHIDDKVFYSIDEAIDWARQSIGSYLQIYQGCNRENMIYNRFILR